MTSVASQIGQALKARLETITALAGYPVPLKKVFFDKIPMGLELSDAQLPVAFLLDDGASYSHQHSRLDVARAFRIQLVNVESASDETMSEMIREVAKAVYANSPTATVEGAFRFHERVVWVELSDDESDLHMIEANRIAALRLIVHYRTRPYDL